MLLWLPLYREIPHAIRLLAIVANHFSICSQDQTQNGAAMSCFIMLLNYPTALETHLRSMCKRSWLQVVKGGSPCHLYFDTEFATECNPGLDGEALLDKLLVACKRVFRSVPY